jgi:ornithine cyclodeaminase/alanine dehydrogenase-like protein (mu-crystallin family)
MLFLNEQDLQICMDLDKLRNCMRDALLSFSLKKSINFPRAVFNIDPKNNAPLGFMPATDESKQIMGYKAVSVFHHNKQKNLNPHQGIVVLLDAESGQVKCILDGSFITAVRTAAVSAFATELLSNPNSTTLALIGAGRQAIEHAKAIARIRPIENIYIYSQSQASFDMCYNHLKMYPFNICFRSSPKEAVSEADIAVTCTASKKSLLNIDEFPFGIHINAIGACRPGDKEIALYDQDLLKIFLDSKESCLLESDEIMDPLRDNSLSPEKIIGEIGECAANQIPGREHSDDVTVFKSVGLSIEDVYAAEFFYQTAKEKQIGQQVIL